MTTTELFKIYLDYRNNFLSVQGFANYYNLPFDLATNLINYAREVYSLAHDKE
jgi:hypothetical protein